MYLKVNNIKISGLTMTLLSNSVFFNPDKAWLNTWDEKVKRVKDSTKVSTLVSRKNNEKCINFDLKILDS